MKVEEFIVIGEGLVKKEVELVFLKNSIRTIMEKKGYSEEIYASQDLLSMRFQYRILSNEEILKIGAKKGFFKTKDDQIALSFQKKIEGKVDDLPFKITILFKEVEEEWLIKIICEPIIIQKRRQLRVKLPKDEFDISSIIERSKIFIEEILFSIGAIVIRGPSSEREFARTSLTSKLQNLGLERIVELIKQGKNKLDRGDIEDGLVNLRSVWEMVIKQAMVKRGLKPKNKVDENLKILKERGFLEEEVFRIIKNTTGSNFGEFLSNKSAHKREKLGFKEADFLFFIFEESMGLLIDKILLKK